MPGLGGILVTPTSVGYGDPHNWSSLNVAPQILGQGLVAQNYDFRVVAASSAALTSGTIYLARLQLAGGQFSFSNVIASVATVGATLTAGQCFAGVYDDQGNQLGVSADQSTTWTTLGRDVMALTNAPITVSAPFVVVAIVSNGTTNPQFVREAGVNVGQTQIVQGAVGAAMQWAINGTGQTTLPATLNYTNNTSIGTPQSLWVGLS